MPKVRWVVLCAFCSKCHKLSSSAKVLKIGLDLTKLQRVLKWELFLETQCSAIIWHELFCASNNSLTSTTRAQILFHSANVFNTLPHMVLYNKRGDHSPSLSIFLQFQFTFTLIPKHKLRFPRHQISCLND